MPKVASPLAVVSAVLLTVFISGGASRAQVPGFPPSTERPTRPPGTLPPPPDSGDASPPAPESPATSGAGAPLPPLTINYSRDGSKVETILGKNGNAVIRASGGVIVTCGDLRIDADQVEYNEATSRIVATGNAVVTRGDESVRGQAFTINLADGLFFTENATAASPPFYVRGQRIERTPTGLSADNASVSTAPRGTGEFQIRARRVTVVEGDSITLQRPSFYLFGTRLLTLKSYKFSTRRRAPGQNSSEVTLPVTFRSSQISGFVFGFNSPFTITRNTQLNVGVAFPSKQPLQYNLSLGQDLSGVFATRKKADPNAPAPPPGPSPLRQLLTARRPPPPPDPVLDFVAILSAPDTLSSPTATVPRFLRAEVRAVGNQEIGDKRQGLLLLTRQPEARVTGVYPFGGSVPRTNDLARPYLRRLRPVIGLDITTGRYQETRLDESRLKTSRGRTILTADISTLPLLLGSRFLVRGGATLTTQNYTTGERYYTTEYSLTGAVVFGTRTALGASVIKRVVGGKTPFFFDQVDTSNEAQLGGQIGLGRVTLAAQGRYDTSQSKFFDYEVAIAYRGQALEPRFGYRKLNQQFGFGVNLTALSTRY